MDGKSAAIRPVTLHFDLQHVVKIQGEGTDLEYHMREIDLPAPLGRTRFIMNLPDGGRVEFTDEKAHRALHRLDLDKSGMDIVHWIESRWAMVIGCLFGMAGAVVLFFWLGIPLMAKSAAYSLPADVNIAITGKAMEILDTEYFAPSGLALERQQGIRDQFRSMVADLENWDHYQLEFRSSERIGANALALPSGTIVITDALIELAEQDDEIFAVLAHEIAHVEYRHGLQSVLQDVGVFVLISIMIGDVGVTTSIVAALPTLLVTSGYSRHFEEEADTYAAEWLLAQGKTTEPMQSILIKLSENNPEAPFGEVLSSHPELESRIKNLQRIDTR